MSGLCMEHSSETDLTYEKPDGPIEIRETITVIVVPVYGGRIAETALERMDMIRGEASPVIPVVLYGNRDYDDALLELKDWCVAHGFTPVAAAAFIGEHSYSRPDRPIAAHRPNQSDLRRAMEFGTQIGKRIGRINSICEVGELMINGNFPYKEKSPKTPQTPQTVKELCTQCGFCIEICPVQAICLRDEIVSDVQTCIKCCACVKQCPNQARVFDTPYTDILFKNCATRHKPELLYSVR